MTEPVAIPDISPPLLKQSRLIELTARGLSLHQVASAVLREALNKRYPDLNIDPDHTLIATPVRDMESAQMPVTGHDIETLPHALVRQGMNQSVADYIEGEHFLTRTPNVSQPVHLAVDMDELTSILNEHAPLLFVEYQQRQLDYWNEPENNRPRWQVLSDLLCSAVDVQAVKGWDAEACRLARWVAQHPDRTARAGAGSEFTDVRACVMDVDLVDAATHVFIAGALILSARIKQRDLILMYTVIDGYESFDSLEALGASMSERLAPVMEGRPIKWRLIEPEGNIFDAVAQAQVINQLAAFEALDPSSRSINTQRWTNPHKPGHLGPLERVRFNQLKKAVPDWLQTGSTEDIQDYSRYITELGSLRDGAQRDLFRDDDLPPIKGYAEQKMREAILADKTSEGAADLPLDRLRIIVTHSLEAAGFTMANPLDQHRETLGEFALQNTAPYLARIEFSDTHPVPAWLTVDFLSAMADRINVGQQYPKLLKSTLIDDPVRAARQKSRYKIQLPILLPLLALECKLRRLDGVDERGYACICQLMDAIASNQPSDDQPVTIRPLAFLPLRRLSGQPDIVANMYIIGPRDHRQGPCLLYRPMLDRPLMQFASLQNLMYALYQSGELRESVLAWLESTSLSFEYSQYVFPTGLPSPWMVTQLAFEPFMHLDLNGPIALAGKPLTGDILESLYTANSQALIELADRQSVSNSERRWALLADSGWAIFSVASNFMSGAPGAAVWAWQTIEQIQQSIEAHEHGDTLISWKSTADALLTLGIILTHHMVARRNRALGPLQKAIRKATGSLPENADLELQPLPPARLSVTHDTLTITGEIPSGHLSLLEPETTLRPDASARFKAMLDRFKVSVPDLRAQGRSSHNHLYTHEGKTYAQVGALWFQVLALEGEPVHIVHPDDPARIGMAVKYDAVTKKWHWDPRLRLRGGSPTGRIEAMRRAKAQKKDDAWQALEQFIEREPEEKRGLLTALLSLPKDATEAFFEQTAPRYLDQAMKLGNDYTQALEHLDTWHQNGGGGVFHQAQLMRMTAEQHRCLGSWLRVKIRFYMKASKKIAESFEKQTALPRNEQIETATAATALSDEMIATLQTLHRSLQKLTLHSSKANKLAGELTRMLPSFSELDLKANEIGMSYERCVNENPGPDMDAAREAIGIIAIKAADAGHELIRLTHTNITPEGIAERIELLSQWNDLLSSLDEQLENLPAAHPGQFIQTRLDRVRELIGDFHKLARERLVAEVPEPPSEPAATPVRREPQPSTSQSKVKISKTRPRPEPGSPPVPSESSASIEETPFVKLSAPPPKPELPADDDDLISRAMKLSLHIDNFNRKTREDARRPGRIPADIRDMFDQQASRLEHSAADVDMAFARRHAARLDVWPVTTLSAELRAGASRTRAEGIATYGAMLKQRKPRESYFHWLHDNDQVSVIKDERGRIRTRQRGDYFQEYRILDKTNNDKPLWVAHFHYDKLTDADESYTTAHLKFADAYLLTLDIKTRQTLSNFDAVDNALRRIVNPQVRDLFLKPQPVDKPLKPRD